MRSDVDNDPTTKLVLDAVHRSFTKPQKIGFTRALIDSMSELPVYTPAGVYLGHASFFDSDLTRLCNVIERVTRGLYYHEYGARLPDAHRCVTYALDGFASAGSEDKGRVRQLFDQACLGKERTLGGNVFKYWFQSVVGPEPATLWAFLVYGRVGFVALTMPGGRGRG